MFNSTSYIPNLTFAFSILYAPPGLYSCLAFWSQNVKLTRPSPSENLAERAYPTLPSSLWNSFISPIANILPITSTSIPSSSYSSTSLSLLIWETFCLISSKIANSSSDRFSGFIEIWVLKFVLSEYPLSV